MYNILFNKLVKIKKMTNLLNLCRFLCLNVINVCLNRYVLSRSTITYVMSSKHYNCSITALSIKITTREKDPLRPFVKYRGKIAVSVTMCGIVLCRKAYEKSRC